MSFNIWSVDKHPSIKKILFLIDNNIGLSRFSVQPDSDGTFEDVRLNDPNMPELSAYIFTYGQSENHYGVHLEYPAQETAYTIYPEVHEEVSSQELLDILTVHFNLT